MGRVHEKPGHAKFGPTFPLAPSDLVDVYEDEHHAIKPASDADMLRHLLESKGVTQSQLTQEAGIAKSTISEVLSGKEPMIRKLSEFFKVEVGVLAGNP
jgi:HTH-type transcriptional regulator/antitoxin HigA